STADAYRAGWAGAGRGWARRLGCGRDRRAGSVRGGSGTRGVVAHCAAGASGLCERELAEPEPTTVLGIDETRLGRPRWLPVGMREDGSTRWGRIDPWKTGFVDVAGGQALLGQVDGRTVATVRAWLAARSVALRDGIATVVIDPDTG
ncbi:MAG: hypothetical protein LC808_07190, partial [Actinobacteria bacterium]|nr:hypothetical protein [Actinomycetota bacterium]